MTSAANPAPLWQPDADRIAAARVTHFQSWAAERYGAPGVPLRAFRFDAAICEVCPLRPSCMRARPGKGRVVMIHPQEALLQEARAFQQSEAFSLHIANCGR